VEERHWRRILEETGKDTGEVFNLKTMTLSKVFEMELQNYEEKVLEIIVEAKEEMKNEQNLKTIEEAWRLEVFEVIVYKKSGAVAVPEDNKEKQYMIKNPEGTRQLLEDNILILQSLAGSKYVRAIKSRVAQWEKDLNTISDVIDLWMIVQRKWMYLESIFGNDDIKQQLPEEAKKF
jgi:dynein heavy chain